MPKKRTFIISVLALALAFSVLASEHSDVRAQTYSSTRPVAASLAAVTTPIPTTAPIVVATPVPTPEPTPIPTPTPTPTPVAIATPTPTPTPSPLPVTAGGSDVSAFLLMTGIGACILGVYQLKCKGNAK